MTDEKANRRVIVWETQARQGMGLASPDDMDDAEEIYGYAAGTLASEYESWREVHQPHGPPWEELEPEIRARIRNDARRVIEYNQKGINDQLADIFTETVE